MVRIGVYPTSIYDIDFARNQFTIQFWVWFNHASPDLDLAGSVEVVNAKSTRMLSNSREVRDGRIWDAVKYEAVILKRWDIASYPFDRQTLQVKIENTELQSAQFGFEADVKGSRISPELILDGWEIGGMKVVIGDQSYNTAYGDPSLSADGPSVYSRATMEIDIKRSGWRLLFYNFIGFFFAIALALLVVIVNSSARLSEAITLPTKLGISTGAIFAAVGAAYAVQSMLPTTTSFTVADVIQATAFLGAFLATVSSIVIEVMGRFERTTTAFAAGRLLLVMFFAIVAFDIYVIAAAIVS